MSGPRSRILWLSLPLLGVGLYAARLAIALTHQAVRAGTPESLLLAWVFAFVLGLPLLMLGLAVGRAFGGRRHAHRTIPNAGEKIPELGQ